MSIASTLPYAVTVFALVRRLRSDDVAIQPRQEPTWHSNRNQDRASSNSLVSSNLNKAASKAGNRAIRVAGKAGSLATRISVAANANNRVARVANSTAIKTPKRVASKGAASKVDRAGKDARDALALTASN